MDSPPVIPGQPIDSPSENYTAALAGLEDAADGFVACDSQYHIIYLNTAAGRLFGKPKPELLGRTPWEASADAAGSELEPAARRVVAARDSATLEYFVRHLARCLEVRLSPEPGGGVFIWFHDITERKRAEQALRQSEADLKEALLAAQMGVWEWTQETGTVIWDENLYRIAGRDPRLPPPSHEEYTNIYTSQSLARLTAAVERALSTGTPYEIDMEMVRPDGSRRWLISRGGPLRDASGSITGLRGTVQDITERREFERVLGEKTEELEMAQRVAAVGSWVWDLQSDSITWSDEMLRLAGGDPGQTIAGFSGLERFHSPESWGRMQAAAQRARQEGTPYEIEAEALLPDGQRRSRVIRGEPERDANGRIVKLRGTAQDITERKQAEEALRESEERFRATFEGAGIGMALVDFEGRPLKSNPALQHMLGYSEEELGRMAFTEFTYPDDRERDWKLYSELAAGKRATYEIEKRYIHKDGTLLYGLLTVSLVKGKLGHPAYCVGMVQDITKRKRAEEELRASEARFRALITDAPVAIGMGRNGITHFVNTEYVRLFGLQNPEEAFGRPILDQHAPQCHELIRDHLRRRQQGLFTPKEYESVGLRKDGSTFPMHVAVSMVELADGPVTLGFLTDLTERKRTEKALRESDQRYKDFITYSHEGVWRVEMDPPIPVDLKREEAFERLMQSAYIAECNLAQARIMGGASPEEVVGKRVRDLVSPSDQGRLESFQDSARSGTASRTVEFQGLDKEGNPRHYLRTEIPIIENGMFVRAWGITRDVTEIKRAQEALRRSEAYLAEGQRLSHTGSWAWNLVSDDIYWSQETYRVFGFDPPTSTTSLREAFLERVHPEDRPRIEQGLRSATSQVGQYETDYRIMLPGGTTKYIHEVVYPVTDEAGTVIERYGLAMDVTERKRAEEALHESEERFRSFMNNSPTVAWMKDAEGRYVYLSETYEKRLGVRMADLVGKQDSDVYPREIAEQFRANDRAVLNAGHPIELIEESVGPDGQTCHWLVYKFPMQNASGEILVGGISIDITDRMRMEKDLESSRDQLRALAARLQSIREEERKRVARDIHDQLGQAMTAIRIDLSSLIYELPPGEERAAKRAASIMNLVDESIRTVRRISTELRPGILDDLGLVAALEWAGEDFQARLGTACRLDLPPDDLAVGPECSTAIFRIFQETLTNVARHSGANQVKVRLQAEDGGVILEVHDNGSGISDDKLSQPASLGLLGMRERAMLLGGDFTITSAPGKGTTVKVRIPRAAGPREAGP